MGEGGRPPPARASLERRGRFLHRLGRLFHFGAAGAALGLLGLLGAIVVVLGEAASSSITRNGFHFLIGTTWDPTRSIYGGAPFIFGTVLTSALALAMAVPVALGVAIFLSDLAPVRIREPLAYAVDLLAAVPSIVYGFWGVLVLVPIMQRTVEPQLSRLTDGGFPFSPTPVGLDYLTASLVLAIMVLPTISAVSREAMQAVSRTQREVALSLGATRWEATRIAVLGPARSGILGGILLGLSRAVGETIAVALTIGNNPNLPTSLFSSGATIASLIANELPGVSTGTEPAALVELGLVLLAVTILVNVAARLLIRRIGAARTTPEGKPRRSTRRRILDRLRPHHLRSSAARPAASAAPDWRAPHEAQQPARLMRRRAKYYVMAGLTVLCTVLALVPLISIVGTAVDQGGAALLQPTFYTEGLAPACNPATQSGCTLGGIGPYLEGTLLLIGLSGLIAIPLGILVGIYLAEYGRNRFARLVSFFAEVMTGLPTILIGTFVFVLFVAVDHDIAQSLLTGSLALAVLMLPLVARTTEEALRAVPVGVRESALALGFPRHWVTLRVTLGCARAGIITGALLASARAGGETAALLLTAGWYQFWPLGIDQKVGSLPLVIFYYGSQDYPYWTEAAWGAALLLLGIMLSIGLLTRIVFRRHTLAAEIG